MTPENFWGNNEDAPKKPLLDQTKENEKNEIRREVREMLAKLKADIEGYKQDNQNKPLENKVQVIWENTVSVGVDEKGEKVISIGVVKKEIINSQNVTERLIAIHPKQAEFIKKIIIPNVKITGESYSDISSQLDYALKTIDMNHWSRTVYARQGEYRPQESLNFWDANSTNHSVQNLRKVIKELNAKYFTTQVSPFNPALYN